MRPGENEGIHYHYVSRGKFESEIHSKNMLEWANVHGNLYGTSLNEIKRIQGLGKHPLLEIDVQGWEQARPQLIDAVSIFILPPSMRQMWERLEQRGTDSFETRWERMQNARSEIAAALHYNYFLVNDVLEQAYSQLQSITIKQSPACLDHAQGLELCQKLMVELDDPEFLKSIREA
jgi:guanylate kinase